MQSDTCNHVLKHDECTGCGACYNICPKDSITMQMDSEGFYYPVVNEEGCANCGLCLKVCKKENVSIADIRKAYAVNAYDDELRKRSSSGGVFGLISSYILQNGGYVFGAGFDEHFNVRHECIDNQEDLDRILRSKYAQSSIGSVFKEIKQKLSEDSYVLFCGTPCQCKGLCNYLGKSYEKLLIIDFVCHGVPSPEIWQQYLSEFKKKPVKVNFRDKSHGWKGYYINIDFEDGSNYLRNGAEDEYIQGFLWDIYLRPSCYRCDVKDNNRYSDLTIADFWGINEVEADMNDNKGTSLVVTNTVKGENYYKECIECNSKNISVNLKDAMKRNVSYYEKAHLTDERKCFYKLYYKGKGNKRLADIVKNFTKPGIFGKIRRKMNYKKAHISF